MRYVQKDITEKILLDYNEIFSDIINVLLFDGENVVAPETLENATPVSQYKADDSKVHEQERDVAKYWNSLSESKINVRVAFLGFENQSKPGNREQNIPHLWKPLIKRLSAFCTGKNRERQ